jgi:hypothetical protein
MKTDRFEVLTMSQYLRHILDLEKKILNCFPPNSFRDGGMLLPEEGQTLFMRDLTVEVDGKEYTFQFSNDGMFRGELPEEYYRPVLQVIQAGSL